MEADGLDDAKVKLPLTIVLDRDVAERLSTRAIREGKNRETLVAEILKAAAHCGCDRLLCPLPRYELRPVNEVESGVVGDPTPPCCSRNALSLFTSSGNDERPMIALN